MRLDVTGLLIKHGEWTEKTFGSGLRTKGITDHIRKELIEIENDPKSLEEWVDVIMLALDGARRIGATPVDIFNQLENKLTICATRVYPFPSSEEEVSEHDRSIDFSQRGLDWIAFSSQVLAHIENYTVPQYGDKGEDQASEWSVEMLIEQTKKYANRYGKNQRKGQEVLDFMKGCHYLQMAFTKFKENQVKYSKHDDMLSNSEATKICD